MIQSASNALSAIRVPKSWSSIDAATLTAVMALGGQLLESNPIAVAVTQCHKFVHYTAAQAAYGMGLSPHFASWPRTLAIGARSWPVAF
jgi:hypothetical protein